MQKPGLEALAMAEQLSRRQTTAASDVDGIAAAKTAWDGTQPANDEVSDDGDDCFAG